ncbi:hypothetical protein LSH36_821g00036 [Paralvinella palmiformis]|uniref:Cyclic nucleotide-binding domain-containing protein n=1 Tax=Paralvinella palmiformis TaxID=53620 RepID=A0AAD9MS25_9ANNE|nr:hypothetical protein LSH36_821g00036 [Paralvinella palmiformis]
MDILVKKVLEHQRFEDEIHRRREEELQDLSEVGNEAPPVFNKHHYSAKGNVIITEAAREIMERNEKSFGHSDSPHNLSPGELLVMRGVVDVLRLIHKGVEYVKDALSHVVTVELYQPHAYVAEKDHEHALSCYYIVYGQAEVTYDATACGACAVQVFEPNIVYTNSSGEYLGLVSPDGPEHDMTPPATIYTRSSCLLVRIDRRDFHRHVVRIRQELENDKWLFLNSENGPLSYLSVEEKEKLVPAFTKVYYRPNKVLTRQGQISDLLYIIVSGHCRCIRTFTCKDAHVTNYDGISGEIVGSECLGDEAAYHSTVYTVAFTTCFKFHRADLEALSRENLRQLRECYLVKFPDEELLRNQGYRTTAWRRYRQHQVMLVKGKDRVMAPLHLPRDVRWGTAIPGEIDSKLFITFLAGDERAERGLKSYYRLNRSISAYPARGKHPVYETQRQQAKSAPCRYQKTNLRQRSMTSSTSTKMASQTSSEFEVSNEDEQEEVVRDRATYSSLGARHIVRQATEVAEVKSRRRGSNVKSNQSLEEQSLYSTIVAANKSSKSHCAFGRYRLEILRKRLERVRQTRRSLEEERRRRTQEKEFKMALRRPQLQNQSSS